MMAAFAGGLKRPRPEDSTILRQRDVITISVDDSPPPPAPKRIKSTTPQEGREAKIKSEKGRGNLLNQQNGSQVASSAKPAIAASTASSRNQSLQTSRASSASSYHTPTGLIQGHTKVNGIQVSHKETVFEDVNSPYRALSTSNKATTSGLSESRQNGQVETTIQSAGNGQTPHTSSRPLPSQIKRSEQRSRSRQTSAEDEDDIEILNSFTRPPPPLTQPRRPSVASSSSVNPELTPRPQVYSNLSFRPSPAPSQASHLQQSVHISHPSQRTPAKSSNFTLEVPLSQDLAPLHLRPSFIKAGKALFDELKQSTRPALERLEEVELYFGQNGFSDAFPVDETERLLKCAPNKVRKIERSAIALDFGKPKRRFKKEKVDGLTLVHPIEQVKNVLTSRFNELHSPPITFDNKLNDRRLNGKFQFVNQYIIQVGVRLTDQKHDSGCDCPGGECRPQTCRCITKQVQHENEKGVYHDIQLQTYTQHPDTGTIVLSDSYILSELDPSTSNFEIAECNECCGCPPSCWNRVVERGRTFPLEIFETAKCGFGVRSPKDILRGQFIELYLGEVLTEPELRRRENAKEEGSSSYVFSLDFFKGFKGALQEGYHIDGENFGTAMRFVNHSCAPNARSFTVVRNKADKNVYYIAFFAIADIKAGQEICIDYQNALPPPEVEAKVEEADKKEIFDTDLPALAAEMTIQDEDADDRVRCYCGAENCRKWLWPKKNKRRRKKKIGKDK